MMRRIDKRTVVFANVVKQSSRLKLDCFAALAKTRFMVFGQPFCGGKLRANGFFLLFAVVVLLTSCAHLGRRAELPKLALAPVSYGGQLAQTQRLTFSPLRANKKTDSAVIDALLEITPDTLQLVGFMLNQQMLKLHWDGAKLDAEQSEKLPVSVTPAQVLRDVQLVYWPNAPIQAALPLGWQIQTSEQQRELRQNGRLWLRIRYQTDAQRNGVIELENLAEGYRLHIEALSESGVQP